MDKIWQFWRCLWPQSTYFTGFWHFIEQTTNRLVQRIINSSPVVHVMCLAAQNIDVCQCLTYQISLSNVSQTDHSSSLWHVVHHFCRSQTETEHLWPGPERENEGRRVKQFFYRLCTSQKKTEVCLIKKQKWLATVITDIPLSLLTTGLLCDLTYICVRYCTYNKTNTCTHSPVG